MIQVLLLILKIIGITIAAVLGLILLIFALVLFVPICYRIRVIHNPERTEVNGKVTFLYPVLSLKFQYLKKFFYKGRLLGYAFLDSEKEKKKNKPKRQKKQKQGKQRTETEEATVSEPTESEQNQNTMESVKVEQRKKEDKAENVSKPGFFEKLRLKMQKIRETISNIIKKAQRLFHQKEEVQRILNKPVSKSAISFAWQKVKGLLRHILPRKLKGYLAYGSNDPATTGQLLGVVAILYAKTGRLVDIRPNFQEEQLECDLEFRGNIQVFTILVIAIKLLTNQELRLLIQELKNIKEID